MSELSEALDKALRQLYPTKLKEPVQFVAVDKNQPRIVESRDLAFKQGSSDKVYHIQIVEESAEPGKYNVTFQYGRRNGTLTTGEKTSAPVDLGLAREIFLKVVSEKKSKGYR